MRRAALATELAVLAVVVLAVLALSGVLAVHVLFAPGEAMP